MGIGYDLNDLRAAIDDINRAVLSEKASGEVLNSDVLKRLENTRPHLIEAYAPQLIRMALTKLLNDVCRRNAVKKRGGSQHILFSGFQGIPSLVTIEKGKKKATEKLTVNEIKEWRENNLKKSDSNDKDGFNKFLDHWESFAESGEETIEEIFNRVNKTLPKQKSMDL